MFQIDLLNLETGKLLMWFRANKLSLNPKRLNLITVFKPSQKRTDCDIQLSIENQHVVRVKKTYILGVILD